MRVFYKCSDDWIRQEHIRLKASRVQNDKVSRDSYGNSKEGMKWAFMSKNQLLDWCQIVNEEMAIYLQDLRKLYYSFSFYSLDLFFIFLD